MAIKLGNRQKVEKAKSLKPLCPSTILRATIKKWNEIY